MSYIDFESDGVEYRLILSRHGSKSKEPITVLDALVFETGNVNHVPNAPYITLSDYVTEIKENSIPIYSVDNNIRNPLLPPITHVVHSLLPPAIAYGISKLVGVDNNTAYYIALGTLFGETVIGILPSFLGNGVSKIFAKINSALSLVKQSPIEELRNALVAKKIKEGVIPHLLKQYPERFQERNPRIGIIYGSGHSGIKECLESDLRTGFSLKLHRHYGLRYVLDTSSLRDFYEYSRLGDTVRFEYQKLQVGSI